MSDIEKAIKECKTKIERYKNVIQLVLCRDLYTCEDCGKRAEEVHHEIKLTPENINDTSITLNLNLLHSLCHDCHKDRRRGL